MDAYATDKIREAVERHRGNSMRAQQHILTQIQGDERLLRGITQPFVAGIVAMAIEKAGGGIGQWTSRPSISAVTPPSRPRAKEAGSLESSVGEEKKLTSGQLDAVLSRIGTADNARENTEPQSVGDSLMGTSTAPKTGQSHLKSLKALASAYQKS